MDLVLLDRLLIGLSIFILCVMCGNLRDNITKIRIENYDLSCRIEKLEKLERK